MSLTRQLTRMAPLLTLLLLGGCAVVHKRGPDVDEVIGVYQKNLSPTETCYRTALKEDPALEGHVTLEWTVNDKGQVINSHIAKSELANTGLHKCLLSHLNSLKFNPTRRFSKATVEYELNFRRGPTK